MGETRTFSNERIRKITIIGMLCALSYISMFIFNGRIPIVQLPGTNVNLSYDPKDIFIIIGGFIYGPLTCFIISFIVSFIEMITVSSTQLWGFVMNIVSTCSFACTAAFIYKRRKDFTGAAIGLAVGCLAVTGMMTLWNYAVTPIYTGAPRAFIADMLLPAFIPFNLIKSGINLTVTLILYKPMTNVARSLKI